MRRERQRQRKLLAVEPHVADLLHLDDAPAGLRILEFIQHRPHGSFIQLAIGHEISPCSPSQLAATKNKSYGSHSSYSNSMHPTTVSRRRFAPRASNLRR